MINKNISIISSLLLSCFFFLYSACSFIEEQGGEAKLPEAVGDFAEMVIVGDRQSTAILQEGITLVYGTQVAGIAPPEEPLYKVRYTDESYFKGFFQKHISITLLLHKGNINLFTPFFNTGALDKVAKRIEAGESGIVSVNNVWAKPQRVNFIFSSNAAGINDYMIKNAEILRKSALKTETQIGISKIFGPKIYTDSFFINHFNKSGYGLPKAPSFRIAANRPDFIWLRKEGKKYDYGIYMYDEAYTDKNQLTEEYIIALRNKMTKKYIHGTLDSTYVTIEPLLKPVSKVISFNAMYAIETRGWWKLERDYMGGPFVLYTIYDEKSGKIITLEGNVFAPNEPKVAYLRELEVILHALKTK
jgi:hypothetical protein